MAKNILTTEEFISKAIKKHGHLYDYSKVLYTRSHRKVSIICPVHGEFYQAASAHIFGKGCLQCGVNRKKLLKKTFLIRANTIHNDKYDYSKVNYKNLETKVCIICFIHGEFHQRPSNHLAGRGCPLCGMEDRIKSKSLTIEEFITKSKNIHHGNKYDYSKVIYKKAVLKVCIICPIHGEFHQRPTDHLSGNGCKKCEVDRQRLNREDFISRSDIIHKRKYDYSKVYYKSTPEKVQIICPKHGDFWQRAGDHLKGANCPTCGHMATAKGLTLTQEEFIDKARNIHRDKYDYSLVKYKKSKVKVCIICSTHGKFFQSPGDHLQGKGCIKCNFSKGELAISDWLQDNNFEYEHQYSYPDLRGRGNQILAFDFYVSNKNLLVEFDGEQHFKPVRFNGISSEKAIKNFKKTKYNDALKNQYCNKNSIPLLRISYEKSKVIPEILADELIMVDEGQA